jgi:hypothetical protein
MVRRERPLEPSGSGGFSLLGPAKAPPPLPGPTRPRCTTAPSRVFFCSRVAVKDEADSADNIPEQRGATRYRATPTRVGAA